MPLFILLVGTPAMGQRFLPAEIVQANVITPEMMDRIVEAAEPPTFDLVRIQKTEDITKAREQLLQHFRVNQPSDAFLQALSKAINKEIAPAVQHESDLVRINAMIVLGSMVDDGSMVHIDAGLKDKSDAVKRIAMQALGNRMRYWKGQATGQVKIDNAIKQVLTIVGQAEPPHPAVVGSALQALVLVNTPQSLDALIEILNKRVAWHAENPNAPYDAERAAIENYMGLLVGDRRAGERSNKGMVRAMARYSKLIIGQMQAGRVPEEQVKGGKSMLFQCLQGMANVCATANVKPPKDDDQARNWINNDRWGELLKLVNEDWSVILGGEPFGLKPAELAIEDRDNPAES